MKSDGFYENLKNMIKYFPKIWIKPEKAWCNSKSCHLHADMGLKALWKNTIGQRQKQFHQLCVKGHGSSHS